MKKNGEFVGVDEKFIPENEKYVDDSLVGDKENAKKIAKRFGIGYLVFWAIFFAIFISMMIFSIFRFFSISNKINESRSEIFENDMYKTNTNAYFEQFQGTKSKFILESALDEIVKNNKTTNHEIVVVYKEKTFSTEDEIVTLKHSLDKWIDYECSVDYDSKGVVNKITIKDIK